MATDPSNFYLGNPNLKKVGTEIQFTQEQIEEYLKCKEDPVYFAKNYIKIISLDEGIVPFKMWDFQEELIEKFHEHKLEINAAFGRKLNWDSDPDKNACRIEMTYNGFDLHDQTCWGDFAKRMVSDMNKLNYALEPHYSNL